MAVTAVTWRRGDDPVVLPYRLGQAATSNLEALVEVVAEGETVLGTVYGFGTDHPRTVVLREPNGALLPIAYDSIEEVAEPEQQTACTCGAALAEHVVVDGPHYPQLCPACRAAEGDDSDDRDGKLRPMTTRPVLCAACRLVITLRGTPDLWVDATGGSTCPRSLSGVHSPDLATLPKPPEPWDRYKDAPMTGDGHQRRAEELLVDARDAEGDSAGERYCLDAAQVHATLALAARQEGTAVMLDSLTDTIRLGFEHLWAELAKRK